MSDDNLPPLPSFQPVFSRIMTIDGTKRVEVYNALVEMLHTYARAALAAQPAEPVAEIYRGHYGNRSRNIGFLGVRPLVPSEELPPAGTKLYAAPQPPAQPVALDVSLDQAACELLFAMVSPSTPEDKDYSEIRLQLGDGHSGWGLYVSMAEYPEEGSTLLAVTPPPQGEDAPTLTDEQIADIAHRAAWRYRHSPSHADVRYEFSPHTLIDFARAVIAATKGER